MADLIIRCGKCGGKIGHQCWTDGNQSIRELFEFKLHGLPAETLQAMKDSPHYSEGNEDAPFFTEAFLYCLIGKDEGRSVLGMVKRLIAATGIDPSDAQYPGLYNRCPRPTYEGIGLDLAGAKMTCGCGAEVVLDEDGHLPLHDMPEGDE